MPFHHKITWNAIDDTFVSLIITDGSDLHGYNRRSVFPSEDHCGGQISDTHSSIGNAPSSAGGSGASPQLLKWQAHQVDTWHDLCDGALQDM